MLAFCLSASDCVCGVLIGGKSGKLFLFLVTVRLMIEYYESGASKSALLKQQVPSSAADTQIDEHQLSLNAQAQLEVRAAPDHDESDAADQEHEEAESGDDTSLLYIIIGVCAFIILVVLVAYIRMSRRSQKQIAPQTAITPVQIAADAPHQQDV